MLIKSKVSIFLKDFILFVYLTELGLCRCTWAFSLVVASGGYSVLVLRGLLIAVTSLVVEHRFQGARTSVTAAYGLSSRGPWTLKHRQYLWHRALVAPWHVGSSKIRIEPMSFTLTGGFFATESPGKPQIICFISVLVVLLVYVIFKIPFV